MREKLKKLLGYREKSERQNERKKREKRRKERIDSNVMRMRLDRKENGKSLLFNIISDDIL